MSQWFCGRVVGSYVGKPEAHPRAAIDGTRHFRVRIYEVQIDEVTLLDAAATETDPADAAPSTAKGAGRRFLQSSVEDATVLGILGPGSRFRGPISDVTIDEVELSHPTVHAGRSYGRISGRLRARCEVPEPEAELEAPRAAARLEVPPRPSGGPGQLDFEADAPASGNEEADAEGEAERHPASEDANAGAVEIASRTARPATSGTTLYVLAACTALAIAVVASPEAGLLWCAFVLPTLLARSLFGGVLRDSTGVRVFGVLSMLIELFAVSSLVSSWWWSSCRELALWPLLGIVFVLFPSGLLPSAIPLLANAAGLALVLGLWARAPASACARPAPGAVPATRPSVGNPGVPRTNEDGSWPKRPPG